MNKAKFLESLDKSEVYDDVSEKKALPELLLKRNIMEAQENMLVSERKMMHSFRLYRRFYFQQVVAFESDIILLFSFIKAMIIDYGIKDNDKMVYLALVRSENGQHFNPDKLIVFKNFLLKYLHLLNITNLFQGGGKSFEQKLKEQY